MYVCSQTWLFYLANLPRVDLIIRPAERTKRVENFFLPFMTMCLYVYECMDMGWECVCMNG